MVSLHQLILRGVSYILSFSFSQLSFSFPQTFSQLRQKLYFRERERMLESTQSQRRVQIGTRDRSEKIRTYNFQQARVTDHRVGLTVGSPETLMQGGSDLEEMMETLSLAHAKELLMERLKKFQKEKV